MSSFGESRRDFLKSAATTAGAAAVQALHTPAFAAGKELISFGSVGLGDHGADADDQAVKLVAICDAFEHTIEASLDLRMKLEVLKRGRAETQFTGLNGSRKLFEHCNLELLCMLPGLRPRRFEAAMALGRQILLETPRRIAWPEENRPRVGACLQSRAQNQSVYLETFDRFMNGQFGEILSGHAYWNQSATWYRLQAPSQSDLHFQVNNWHHFKGASGAPICERYLRNLDLASGFFGETPPGASGTSGPTARPAETDDRNDFELRYAGSGIVIASPCRLIDGTQSDVREEFRTTKGILHIQGKGNGAAWFSDYSGKKLWAYESAGAPCRKGQEWKFADLLKENGSV